MEKPLEGVTVLDCTIYLAGPFCTLLLAGLGANVIKVERPGTGDPARSNPPYFGANGITFGKPGADDMSLSVLKRNRNKKSITLNLRAEKGKAIFKDLVRKGDVVTENFTPGTMARLGLGYDVLKEVNPRIIYASSSGFGQSGPYKDLPAFDPIIQAMSGLMAITGFPDKPPVRSGIAEGDLVAALFLTIGVLGAIRYRDISGKGQAVDTSMQDGLISLLFDEALDLYAARGIPTRTGNLRPRFGAWNVYDTKNGYVTICAVSDVDWRGVLRTIGREDLLDDPRYVNLEARVEHVQDVQAIISDQLKGMDREEAIRRLRAEGVPCGPVADVGELTKDPHLLARSMFTEIVHPKFGRLKEVAAAAIPIKFSETPATLGEPAPMLGQHNDAIYSSYLGYNSDDIQKLKEEGVI